MKLFGYLVLVAGVCVSAFAFAGEPSYIQGKNIFIETGVDPVDKSPTWYAPMMNEPYAPYFEMLATKGTAGRYYSRTYVVTLKDMIKFH